MSKTALNLKRLLSIYPNTRGFGFAVLEGNGRLIEWGVVQVKTEKHERCLARICRLIERFDPDLVVTEHPELSLHRTARVRKLLAGIEVLSNTLGSKYRGVSRNQVKRGLSNSAVTKQELAEVIAQRFPELATRVPPPRKPWMAADPRMAIFEAVALANALWV